MKEYKTIEFVKGLKKIIILAQGPSWYQCPLTAPEGAEIWGSNVIYRDHPNVDRLIFGHDIRGHHFEDDMNLFENLNNYGAPVYTVGECKQLNNTAVIPIGAIMEEFKVGFFLTTIAYMIAMAIMQKPEALEYYGVDMRPDAGGETYGNEKGCVDFWTMVAMGRGIKFSNTLESYILKTKQEGNFPNFRAKVAQNGLVHQIPEHERNPYFIGMNYKIIPVGDEI
uniref:Uncharacterized protein n=1 Tax=viral metagenome TaxID=1070528 RepID=A0A6M3LS15_9ZZZZ